MHLWLPAVYSLRLNSYEQAFMDIVALQTLLDLNRAFYERFGEAFAQKRPRLQPGIARLLPRIPNGAAVLDVGCGHGIVLRGLRAQGFGGCYVGLDFSAPLLALAQAEGADPPAGGDFRFVQRDLLDENWAQGLPAPFDFVTAFSVFHHLPGNGNHRRVLRQIRGLLAPGGQFFHSHWQFLNSPRLRARIQPWEAVGLTAAQVEPNDYLLDWRHQGVGFRYVHLFTDEDLRALAAATGFRVVESFYSDGEGGRLGLYHVWEAADG